MEYRIEDGKELRLIGFDLRASTKGGGNPGEVPAFWQRIMTDHRWPFLMANMKSAAKGGLGIVGVCRDFDMAAGGFIYSIAVEDNPGITDIPPDASRFSVPASTWGKFTIRGPVSSSLQPAIRKIFDEWLPGSGWKHAGTAELEYYADGNPEAPDYVSEYWIPLKR